jgi:hypothetical protein
MFTVLQTKKQKKTNKKKQTLITLYSGDQYSAVMMHFHFDLLLYLKLQSDLIKQLLNILVF